jgi:hypothetical protein
MTASHDPPLVGRDIEKSDGLLVANHLGKLQARPYIPNTNGSVIAGRHQAIVGQECATRDKELVPSPRSHIFTLPSHDPVASRFPLGEKLQTVACSWAKIC